MKCLLSLIFVFLISSLWSAEIPTAENWEEVKRKISLSTTTKEQARTKACEAIDVLKNGKDAKTVYSCVQEVTDINLLPHAILKTAKLIKKLDQREGRIKRILEGITNLDIKSEAQTAIDNSLISDRLATARTWRYLAYIEDELIRSFAAKAIEGMRLQKKSAFAWVCMNLSTNIADYTVLNKAIKEVLATSEKDRTNAMNVWTYIAAIEGTEARNCEIAILNMFIQEEKQGDQPTDWAAFLRILVEKYENKAEDNDEQDVIE